MHETRLGRGASVADVPPASPNVRFSVLSSADPRQRARWVALYSEAGGAEPQGHPSYAEAMQPEGASSVCAAFRDQGGIVLLPMHLRSCSAEPMPGFRDAITPYGYGGPFVAGAPDLRRFWSEWDQWAEVNSVVGLVTRGLAANGLPAYGEQIFPLTSVVVDLQAEWDDIWTSFEGRARTGARKASRSGVQVVIDKDCEGLSDFLRIYRQSMKEREASSFYMFNGQQLPHLLTQLGDKAVLFHALVRDEVVASTIYLMGVHNSYYFLSGANAAGKNLGAPTLLMTEAVRWLSDRGHRHLVLGGGLTEGDGLFKFKRSFAPRGLLPYVITYREVLHEAAVDLVRTRQVEEPGWEPAPNFRPTYRSPGVRLAAQLEAQRG